MNTSGNQTNKNKKFTALAWSLAALVLVIAILLNLIVGRLNITFDMTPNSLYTLTPTTTEYLEQLDAQGEKVDVYFLGKMEELEAELELLALYRTLLAYDEYECFNLIDIDPDANPEILKELNPDNFYNLSQYDFMLVCERTGLVKRIPRNMMYVYEYETDSDTNTQKVVNAEFRAENYLTGAIKSVVEGVQPTVYFLEGHGEIPLSEMTRLEANLRNYNYGAKTLNLVTAEAVPEDACIIIVASPTIDISEEERKKLEKFLEKGGNLTLLMSPNEAKLSYTNLEALMLEFCIGMDYNKIHETDTARHVSNNPNIFMIDFVPASENADADLTGALLEATGIIPYMPTSRSFYSIYGDNYMTCTIDSLIKTATTAIGEPCGGTNEDMDPVQGQALTLAMYSEDSLRNNAKLAVFGSAEFLTDTSMNTDYYIMPLQLFLSTITWMYDSDIDMSIANKVKTYDSLNVSSSESANGYMALFVGIPCVIAVLGIVVWLRRKDA